MKIYSLTIKPESPFGTPLKGDTIFGHFCWQAAENQDFLNGGLDSWIHKYSQQPFAVFSSAFPKIVEEKGNLFAFPKPSIPASFFDQGIPGESRRELLEKRKKDKKLKWMLLGDDLKISLSRKNLCSDIHLFNRHLDRLTADEARPLRILAAGGRQRLFSKHAQAHNTINRLTMTTGTGQFAPFAMENIHFLPGVELVIFVGLDEEATDIDTISKAFANIGTWGFGRDASAGLGRFKVTESKELNWPEASGATACYTLAPCVPDKESFGEIYFTPFTRFGKHGPALVHTGTPFKNPVVMADEGAVMMQPKDTDVFMRPFIGTAITGLSKVDDRTVSQGYSLYLPFS